MSFKKCLLALFSFSVLFFTSCDIPSMGSKAQEQITVNFYNGDIIPFKTIEIEKGSCIPSDIQTDYYDNSSPHHFLFWTTSIESFDDAYAGKITSTTPITSHTSIYGIYTPEIKEFLESSEHDNLITITYGFNSDNLFATKDSSFFPNISIIFENNSNGVFYGDINYSNFQTNKSSLFTLDCEYDIPYLTPGSYKVYISNGFEKSEINEINVAHKKAQNLHIETDDSFANITWTKAPGSTFTVVAKLGGTTIATKTNCIDSATFYGLTNDVTYTFEVKTNDTELSDSITGTPSITVKKPDWVIAMYMDGDNDLNDPIFLDMNEVEYGLYKIRQELSEDPKTGYSSVAAVALWDGWAGSGSEEPYFKKSGSYLYEFGAEKSTCEKRADKYYGNQVYGDTLGEYNFFTNLAISPTTKNLSYTAKDWLLNSSATPANITSNSCGEVNMGNKQTLINYLNWVNAHYKPKKGIILQFSDHGGGPRNAPTYYTLPDGKSIKVEDSGRRALCWDENSLSESFLKTKDVSDALNAAGYGTSKKVDMIIMDVCLGASIEDSYQFKDYAKYMVASPNDVPGYGLNYIRMMEAFTSTATIEDIGKQIVKDYAHFYGGYDWDKYAKMLSTNANPINGYSKLTPEQKLYLEFYLGGLAGITTLSCINLQNVGTVITKINEVADKLISKSEVLYDYKDGNHYSSLSESETDYYPYIIHARKNALSWSEQESYNTSLFYKGSYNWLYDISKFTDTVMNILCSSEDEILYKKTFELKTALSNVIVASWRDTKLPGYEDYGFYAFLDGVKTSDFTGHSYGLNVAGYGISTDETGRYVTPGYIWKFYEDDLDFGADTKWIDLLSYMRDYWRSN